MIGLLQSPASKRDVTSLRKLSTKSKYSLYWSSRSRIPFLSSFKIIWNANMAAGKTAPFTGTFLANEPSSPSISYAEQGRHGDGSTNTNVSLPPVVRTVPNPPLYKQASFSSLLPASIRTPSDDMDIPRLDTEFLQRELGVTRLNHIHSWLWIAGRPMPPRALHYQILLGRRVVITEQIDMHMVWAGGRIFLKPIPRYLFEADFWTKYLSCQPGCAHSSSRNSEKAAEKCTEHWLWKCALGFMLSYVALISHESDFLIAQQNYLLPSELTWSSWRSLVRHLLAISSHQNVNQRYHYGELRLGRLNKIYRFSRFAVLRGYKSGYNQYSDLFRDNFKWVASVFAYVALVLTAMQVGLATHVLGGSSMFQSVSYGFTVFSIIAPLAIVSAVFFIFVVLFCSNWIATEKYKEKRFAAIRTVHGD